MKREEWLGKMGWKDIPFYPASNLPEDCIVGFSELKDQLLASLQQEENPYTYISGMYGFGKTTLLNWLEQEMHRDTKVIALRFSGPPTKEEIVQRIHFVYGARSPLGRLLALVRAGPALPNTVHDVPEFLGAMAPGRRPLILVDEIETASEERTEEGLNELKRITDETGGTMVMAGLPYATERIPQSIVDRRMITIHMRPLTFEETRALVDVRVRILAGGKSNPFSDDAVRTVHAKSGGVARQVNEICRQALIRTMGLDKFTVDASDINAIPISVQLEPAKPPEAGQPEKSVAAEAAGNVTEKLAGTPYAVLTDLEKWMIQFIADNPDCTAEMIAKGTGKDQASVRTYVARLLGQDEKRRKPGIDYPVLDVSKEGRTNRYRLGISLNKLLGRT